MEPTFDTSILETIKIGITGLDHTSAFDLDSFQELLNDGVIAKTKIFNRFSIKTEIIPSGTDTYFDYNYIFCLVNLKDIIKKETISFIKEIETHLFDPRNHLFIIINDCHNLELDSDGELVFGSDTDATNCQEFDENLSKNLTNISFHVFPLSVSFAIIYNKIVSENTIVTLTNEEIDFLAKSLLKKSEKMSSIDKKRNLKLELKKLSLDDKLAETGFTNMMEIINQYLKLIHQKKIIFQNYLYELNSVDITLNQIPTLENILQMIFKIDYFKPEMFNNLIGTVNKLLSEKLTEFCSQQSKNFDDVNSYQKFLTELLDCIQKFDLPIISEFIQKELTRISELIVNLHTKELEKTTDLDKIIILMEKFAGNKPELHNLFKKIFSQSKIMIDNIDKMNKWILFFQKSIELGIPKENVISLLESIIVYKVGYYCDVNKLNKTDTMILYPYCLNEFLLENLSKNFVFKKLHMILSYHLRYSGRNILESIKDLNQNKYQSLLQLENYLLQQFQVKN